MTENGWLFGLNSLNNHVQDRAHMLLIDHPFYRRPGDQCPLAPTASRIDATPLNFGHWNP